MFSLDLAQGAQLRPLEPWQAAEFAAHVDRARDHLKPWLPWATRIVDVATAHAFLDRYAQRQAADQGRIYGIWLGGQLMGGTLFRVFDAEQGVCEIGVWLDPAAEGRGLITRAVQHMIDWAVNVRGIKRVEWRTDPDNTRSQAVAKRIGMQLEGTFRSAYVLNGQRRDLQVWSLVR